ncbi:MAG: metallophosphatase family protein [Candidatus Methylarchaceae archaeon HK01B]|nr:metallophosphatase family protein [Candidatus Methylarchaceae archaeon HK01M]MCP8312418.1 metallophosphatase family protein [Candidatus Methylarchaceae archaeon HK02M1]MCP8318498.1 metallophosphatase family protein [Candidatus Methylarchaceae archaeon HK01B]
MQKVALVSDIHGNIDALNAILETMRQKSIFCLGDLVGYGANPNEVVKWARENNVKCIMGNHEYAVITKDVSWFSWAAKRAVFWTRSNLKSSNMEFIKKLPKKMKLEIEGIKILLVHGSPTDPIFEYVMPETHRDLFDYYLSNNGVDVIGLGHTHIPLMCKSDKGTIFNPGSVGQPRSGDPRACYAILTIKGRDVQVEHELVEYDVESAARKIMEAGLPKFLAQRLYMGI